MERTKDRQIDFWKRTIKEYVLPKDVNLVNEPIDAVLYERNRGDKLQRQLDEERRYHNCGGVHHVHE